MAIVAWLFLSLVAVLLVLEPVLRAASGGVVPEAAPLFSDSDDEDDPLMARRDRALAALKEIDFDRATGKLSDEDYERMKARFTAEALDALRAADSVGDPAAVQAADAAATSADVEALIAAARTPAAPRSRFCVECGQPIEGGRFCLECGTPVPAAP